MTKTAQDEAAGEESKQKITYMRGYSVFNVEQIDELPAYYYANSPQPSVAQRTH